MQVEGENAVQACREIVLQFRADYQDLINLPANLAHASAKTEDAERELAAVGFENRA